MDAHPRRGESDVEEDVWTPIRGEVNQMDLRKAVKHVKANANRDLLVGSTDVMMRSILSSMNVNEKSLHLVEMKMLQAPPGLGDQPVHNDIAEYDHASKCHSVLLYATASHSTAVPLLSRDVMRPAFRDGDEVTDEEWTENVALCDEKNFTSVRVSPGEVMTFVTTVAHKGVKNRSTTTDRIVIYGLYSPSRALNQGKIQRFPVKSS